METEITENFIPAAPKCKFHVKIGDCIVGFISLEQKERFLRLRTVQTKKEGRVIIHGLQSLNQGAYKSGKEYYYAGVKLDKKIGHYNYSKKQENEI